MSLAIWYLAIGAAIVFICNDYGMGTSLRKEIKTFEIRGGPQDPSRIVTSAMILMAILWPIHLISLLVCLSRGEKPW